MLQGAGLVGVGKRVSNSNHRYSKPPGQNALIQNVPDEKSGQAVVQKVLIQNVLIQYKECHVQNKECYIQPQRVLCSTTKNATFMHT